MSEYEGRTEDQRLFIETLNESETKITEEALDWLFKYGYVGRERGSVIKIRDSIRFSNPTLQLSFRGNEFLLKILKGDMGPSIIVRRFDNCELLKTEELAEGLFLTRKDGSSLFINNRAEFVYRDTIKLNP